VTLPFAQRLTFLDGISSTKLADHDSLCEATCRFQARDSQFLRRGLRLLRVLFVEDITLGLPTSILALGSLVSRHTGNRVKAHFWLGLYHLCGPLVFGKNDITLAALVFAPR